MDGVKLGILLLCCCFHLSQGNDTVSVYLIQYKRRGGCLGEHNHQTRRVCNPQFSLCLTGVNPEVKCTETGVYKQQNDVRFGISLNSGKTNPVLFHYNKLQNKAKLEVKVSNSKQRATTLLETFQVPLSAFDQNKTLTLTAGHDTLTLSIATSSSPTALAASRSTHSNTVKCSRAGHGSNVCKNSGTCQTNGNCCLHNISGCVKAECQEPNPPRCVQCAKDLALVQEQCVACLEKTPILHCKKEATSSCLFRWCIECEEGFYKHDLACEVCPRPHIGCRHVTCSSPSNIQCTSCYPGFFANNHTCQECPRQVPECEDYVCTKVNDVTCIRCMAGYLAYNGQCIACPSQGSIPDCVDVGRDGCFNHWCNKCAPGFFIRGNACDVCPVKDVGCKSVQCNSTEDSYCVQCYDGYMLVGGVCKRQEEIQTPSSLCSDSLSADCLSLEISHSICSDLSSACHLCPRYCDVCQLCNTPLIG